METKRVLIVDDSFVVRAILADLATSDPTFVVVGEAENGRVAVEKTKETKPDLVLLDIEMPGLDGITVAAELRDQAPWCRILIVTTFGRPGYLRRAMDAGVAGFLVKDTPAEDLAQVVRKVHAGGRAIDPALAAESLIEGHNPLSGREREILRLAESGASISLIASELCLSVGTVRNHVSSAIGKTGAANRTEAAVTARHRGWL